MKYTVQIGQSDGDGGIEWSDVSTHVTLASSNAERYRCEHDFYRPRGVVFRVASDAQSLASRAFKS